MDELVVGQRKQIHMTANDLQQIQDHVGFQLPLYYRETLLNYPFKHDSFAEEFMLPNCHQAVKDLNDASISIGSGIQAFFIGSDGGEEQYFVDASTQESGVFVFDLETGEHRNLSPSWSSFLDHIHSTHTEIEEDEKAEEARRNSKKWWQFW
jgi:hypothetical protein